MTAPSLAAVWRDPDRPSPLVAYRPDRDRRKPVAYGGRGQCSRPYCNRPAAASYPTRRGWRHLCTGHAAAREWARGYPLTHPHPTPSEQP